MDVKKNYIKNSDEIRGEHRDADYPYVEGKKSSIKSKGVPTIPASNTGAQAGVEKTSQNIKVERVDEMESLGKDHK